MKNLIAIALVLNGCAVSTQGTAYLGELSITGEDTRDGLAIFEESGTLDIDGCAIEFDLVSPPGQMEPRLYAHATHPPVVCNSGDVAGATLMLEGNDLVLFAFYTDGRELFFRGTSE